jgi:integrase/recombinase XerD
MRDLRHEQTRAAGDLADWLVHLDLEGKSTRTIYAYTRYIAELLREYPAMAVEEFTHRELNALLTRTPRDSRHIVRSVYNRFFEWAEFDERIEHNPMRRVPKMRHPRRRPKDIFSDVEVATLEALPLPDGPLFTIMFGSGIRRGEARRLRRRDISLSRKRLMILGGKGDKDRIIPIQSAVLHAVADLDLLERLNPDDHLWYTTVGGGRYRKRRDPIGDTTFERWYRRGIDAAGVRYLNPHQTRHTYGHRLRESGWDIEERQLLMGHEDIQTTQKFYGHLTIEDVARKMAHADQVARLEETAQ